MSNYVVNEKNSMPTIHPTKAFTRDHFEVDTLVSVLGVHEVGKFHCIELFKRSVYIKIHINKL